MQLPLQLPSNSEAKTNLETAGEGPYDVPPAGGEPSFFEMLSGSFEELAKGNYVGATEMLVLNLVVPAIACLAVIIVVYFAASMIARWITQMLCKRVDQTVGKFVGRLVFYGAMCACFVSILQTMNVGVASFTAILAAVGFAVGLAFQGTLSNFASGILLLVFRPFRVGDVVHTASVMGKIDAIDLFTTTFDTPDNRRLIVPNSAVTGSTIENISFHRERRVEVIVGVDYAASLDATRTALDAAATSLQGLMILGEGRGYQVILENLGQSSVDWKVRAWTARDDFFAAKEKLTEQIKLQLDEAGIGIPFPQMQIHVSDSPSPSNDQHPVPRAAPATDMASNSQVVNMNQEVTGAGQGQPAELEASSQILRSDPAHRAAHSALANALHSKIRPRPREQRQGK